MGGCFRTPVEKAHILSKGAGGTAKPHNIIRLCVGHHRLNPDSFHNAGVWSFADKFGFRERFENAYRIERELVAQKRARNWQKVRTRQAHRRRLICPTCRRRWSGRGTIEVAHE